LRELRANGDIVSQDAVSQKPIVETQKMPMNAKERKLFVKLLTITGVFMLCYTPYLFASFYQFILSELPPEWLDSLGGLFISSNLILNPACLYYLDPIVRSEVNTLLGIKSVATSSRNVVSSSAPPSSRGVAVRAVKINSDSGKMLETVMIGDKK
jgi:hypothetical protein